MAIKGSLKEASLPDVIQLLFLGRRTGCLALADRHNFGNIYFDEGQIIYASIVNRRDRLGDMLVANGRITPEQLEEAIARAGAAIASRSSARFWWSPAPCTRAELEDYIRLQIEEAVYYLFTWSQGTFNFEAGVRPEREDFLVRINPESLLLEGARRVDEWSLIEKKIPSFDLIFSVDRPHIDASRRPRCPPSSSGCCRCSTARATCSRSSRTRGWSSSRSGKALFGLITAGFAHRTGTSAGGRAEGQRRPGRRAPEPRRRLLQGGDVGRGAAGVPPGRRSAAGDGSAPFYLGLIALRQARWADAADSLRAGRGGGGARPAALHNLGVALEQLGRLDEAEVAYGDAAGRARDDARIMLGWSVVALKRGDYQVAQGRLARALRAARR